MNPYIRILLVTCLLLALLPANAAVPENPLLLGDSIYVSQQGVFKFHQNQREPLWSSLVGIETFAPVAYQNLLLVGSTQGLYALELDTGRIAWHIEKQHTLFTPNISRQAFSGSLHGELYAIDPDQGRILWRHQFPGWIYSPAINVIDAKLWTGGQAHKVYSLAAVDGSLMHEIETTQETVFSPLDLGNNQVAFNLFDGNTLVIDASTGKVDGLLAGNSQPSDLHRNDETLYRSHRDGTLAAFDRHKLKLNWSRSVVPQDLTIHPSQPGYLLLSDRDRNLILLNLKRSNTSCRIETEGRWILPLQFNSAEIIFFQKFLQPPELALVQKRAQCK
jgi:outer membrane protein assembly factor BamB